MNSENRRYELKVRGKVGGVGNVETIYKCNYRPKTMDEIHRIAGDYTSIDNVEVDRIITTTKRDRIFVR